jgi:serine/threonine-protein kinase RsbW
VNDRTLRLGPDGNVADAVATYVAELATEAGLPAGKAYWLRLAVEEIATNIVQHGYRGHGPVRLTSEIWPDQVRLHIEDRAPEFDPRSHDPAPQLETTPAEREAGGFGLLLALRKLDAFCYEQADGQNRNTLIMFRPTDSTDAAEGDGKPDDTQDRVDHR